MSDRWVDFDGSIRIPADTDEEAFAKARRLFDRLIENSDYELDIEIIAVEIPDYTE